MYKKKRKSDKAVCGRQEVLWGKNGVQKGRPSLCTWIWTVKESTKNISFYWAITTTVYIYLIFIQNNYSSLDFDPHT